MPAEDTNAKLQPLYLLDDEPIAGQADDLLDLGRFSRLIAETALGTPGPFTIGVYADWGQGKTSLLKQTRDLLERPKEYPHIVTVLFNAWRFEQEEHAIVPLVATIERAVRKRLEDQATLKTKAWENAKKFLSEAHRSLRGLVAGLSLSATGEAKLPFVGKVELGAEWSAKDANERAEELKAQIEEAEKKQWSVWVERCLHLAAFDRLDGICGDVFKSSSLRPEQLPRIVVFVDDLDRCLPERAFRLLESIKLVLSQKGFVFVLAVNERVVNAYLSRLAIKRYGSKNAPLHLRYLDKLVQLPLPVPSHERQFVDFVKRVVETRLKPVLQENEWQVFTGLSELLALGTQYTPRTLVRRINSLLLDMRLRAGMTLTGELGDEQAPYPRFVGLCLVQRTLAERMAPELLRRLRDDKELCTLILAQGVVGARNWLKTNDPRTPRRSEDASPIKGQVKEPTLDEDKHDRWSPIVSALYKLEDEHGFIDKLLAATPGQDWLDHADARDAVSDFVSERPESAVAQTERQQDQAAEIEEPKKQRAVPAEIREAIRKSDAAPPIANPNAEAYWITIPAGEFLMGAQSADRNEPNYDSQGFSFEAPVHKVNHDTYRIGRYPVTVSEFQRFVESNGYAEERYWQAGGFGSRRQPVAWDEQAHYPNRPVIGVNWFEACAYAAWAGCRLPTEAEWERAARGGNGRKYPWGDDPPDASRANYGLLIGRPTPVGVYVRGATPDGINDLAGNVWEWCQDALHDTYAGAPVNGAARTSDDCDAQRVLRGGAWFYDAVYLRSAFRYWNWPDDRTDGIGFRMAAGT